MLIQWTLCRPFGNHQLKLFKSFTHSVQNNNVAFFKMTLESRLSAIGAHLLIGLWPLLMYMACATSQTCRFVVRSVNQFVSVVCPYMDFFLCFWRQWGGWKLLLSHSLLWSASAQQINCYSYCGGMGHFGKTMESFILFHSSIRMCSFFNYSTLVLFGPDGVHFKPLLKWEFVESFDMVSQWVLKIISAHGITIWDVIVWIYWIVIADLWNDINVGKDWIFIGCIRYQNPLI